MWDGGEEVLLQSQVREMNTVPQSIGFKLSDGVVLQKEMFQLPQTRQLLMGDFLYLILSTVHLFEFSGQPARQHSQLITYQLQHSEIGQPKTAVYRHQPVVAGGQCAKVTQLDQITAL